MKIKKVLALLSAVTAVASASTVYADINVGVTLSATGPAASLGIPEKNTFALLPTSIGGQKVNYIILDDASDTTTAVKNTRKLIAENKCTECHASKVVGDGSAIYKPKGRVNAPGVLRGMVEQCNTELNMGLFPEEVTAIAAVLNRDYYRFK